MVLKTSQAVPEILRAPLLTEANVYQFLLKGHAPQSEPFRRWGLALLRERRSAVFRDYLSCSGHS